MSTYDTDESKRVIYLTRREAEWWNAMMPAPEQTSAVMAIGSGDRLEKLMGDGSTLRAAVSRYLRLPIKDASA